MDDSPLSRLPRAPVAALADVSLDAAQQRAVGLPEGRAVLVLGEAGHGKTTVALHRLAHLARARRGRRFRAAVIVPTEGLRLLVERTLVRMGVDVPAWTYERFARRQTRRVFGDVPKRESRDATPATVRLKRDPWVAEAIDAVASAASRAIDDDDDAPPPVTSARATRGDLQHLFGDRALLEQLVERAAGRLPRHAIDETLDHTRVQFGLRSERAWAHVQDRRRLETVDGGSLDERTPDADAGSIDAEDYAILFALDRARAERAGTRPTRPRLYDCLVLDEAQSFAPVELAWLGRALARGGSLVVAGDSDQQLEADGHFADWGATMRSLACDDFERVVLDVSYRCPPEVLALARQALDPGQQTRTDPVTTFASAREHTEWLVRTCEGLMANDPRGVVAVIARHPRTARRLAEEMRKETPVRLVWGGDFSFLPGIDVTTVDQVRGLEFDHVVLPDASAGDYGTDAHARRAMYVALTRAKKTAHLASVGPATKVFVERASQASLASQASAV